MLARTLLDKHYGDFDALLAALAEVLAAQVQELACACLQMTRRIYRATRKTHLAPPAAINTVLDAFEGEKAVHFCFGNYGGQVIQKGNWKTLHRPSLNMLRCDPLVLELQHRPAADLEALKAVTSNIVSRYRCD